jgi:hypothetical protein
MDPDTIYRQWLAGTRDVARVHARHLLEWIQNGGFEPGWGPGARADFMRWVKTHGVGRMA